MALQQYDVVVIGAGPAGVQAAIVLKSLNLSYIVLERNAVPGSFYESLPRHRTLISFNKVNTGFPKEDLEMNMRFDWNSLVQPGNPNPLLFGQFSEKLTPSAEDLLAYLQALVEEYKLNIKYHTAVSRVGKDPEAKDHPFCIEAGEVEYRAEIVLYATGTPEWNKPRPEPEGMDLIEPYSTFQMHKAGFKNKRVLILGKGNSAFETAEDLVPHAAVIHVASPNPVTHAWASHYVGNVRAVNNNFLDTYQLKGGNAILDATLQKLERQNDGMLKATFDFANAEHEEMKLVYHRVIAATGWKFDPSPLTRGHLKVPMFREAFPEMTAGWESPEVSGLYFAGSIMQSRDFHKTMSGFIHGFRHNVVSLVNAVAWKHFKIPIPHEVIPYDKLGEHIGLRLHRAATPFLQPGFLGDLCVFEDADTIKYYPDIPVQYVGEMGITPESSAYILITMEYGDWTKVTDPFRVPRIPRQEAAAQSLYLHPIFKCATPGHRVFQELHLLENVENVYDTEYHYNWIQNNPVAVTRAFICENVTGVSPLLQYLEWLEETKAPSIADEPLYKWVRDTPNETLVKNPWACLLPFTGSLNFVILFPYLNLNMLGFFGKGAMKGFNQRLCELVNEHCLEDATHYELLLHDMTELPYLQQLWGIDKPSRILWQMWCNPSHASLLSDVTKPILDIIVKHPDPLSRFIIIESLEEVVGHLFTATADACRVVAKRIGQESRYFGDEHIEMERSHLDVAAILKYTSLTSSDVEVAKEISEKVIGAMLKANEVRLQYAMSHIDKVDMIGSMVDVAIREKVANQNPNTPAPPIPKNISPFGPDANYNRIVHAYLTQQANGATCKMVQMCHETKPEDSLRVLRTMYLVMANRLLGALPIIRDDVAFSADTPEDFCAEGLTAAQTAKLRKGLDDYYHHEELEKRSFFNNWLELKMDECITLSTADLLKFWFHDETYGRAEAQRMFDIRKEMLKGITTDRPCRRFWSAIAFKAITGGIMDAVSRLKRTTARATGLPLRMTSVLPWAPMEHINKFGELPRELPLTTEDADWVVNFYTFAVPKAHELFDDVVRACTVDRQRFAFMETPLEQCVAKEPTPLPPPTMDMLAAVTASPKLRQCKSPLRTTSPQVGLGRSPQSGTKKDAKVTLSTASGPSKSSLGGSLLPNAEVKPARSLVIAEESSTSVSDPLALL